MADGVTIRLDSSNFDKALRKFIENSNRDARVVVLDQARLFVKEAAQITPPNRWNWGRSVGEKAVKRDIRKIMRRSSKRTTVDPREWHKSHRDARGRVGKALPMKQRAQVQDLDAYIAKRVANVGILASGWVAAASKLGAKLPDWITRHGSSGGSVRITQGPFGTAVRVENKISYVGQGDLARAVTWVLNRRASQMMKQVNSFLARRTSQVGH